MISRAAKQPRRAAATAAGREPVVPVSVRVVFQDQDIEERDWTELLPDLVRKVADDLLSADVSEYIRLRAVCKPWRNSTTDPSILDPRFFPRKWLLIAGDKLRHDGAPERFVNVDTGATLRIRLPKPKQYTHHGSAEGLLVLHHPLTDAVCLLNPLTMAFTDLPTMVPVRDVARLAGAGAGNAAFRAHDIKAAGVVVDTVQPAATGPETNPIPTVVLSLTRGTHTAMVCANPGDIVWRAVDMSCTDDVECALPAIEGGLSVHGRFFVPTRAGDVLAVELRPQPRLTYVARQAAAMAQRGLNERCYLAPSSSDVGAGMLLLRTWGPGNSFVKIFIVDLGNGSLTLHRMSNTDTTVFLPSVTLRSSVFPGVVVPNKVYLRRKMKLLMRGVYI